MPDLYACRLPLPDAGGECFEAYVAVVGSALGSCVETELVGDQGSAAAGPGTVSWRTAVSPDGAARVWSALWEAADPGDEATTWAVTVKVALDAGRTWVIVRVGLISRGFRMSRVRLGLDPVPLVSALVGALPAEEDGRPLVPEPWYADDEDGAVHLSDLLLDADRVLPVVVASRPAGAFPGPKAVLDADAVARSLVGVAHVVVLDPAGATSALTDRIGRPLAVPDGALRLYWPGFTGEDEGRDHPVWLPDDVAETGTGRMRRALLDQLMPVAVVRFSTAALEARIGLATERQRRQEVRRLWAQAKEASLSSGWEEELEVAWRDNELLRAERDELASRLATAEENLRSMARTWGLATNGQAEGGPGPGPAPDGAVEQPASVLEAVEWAASRCPHLVILDEAFDSARRATYRQPGRAWKALLALEEAVAAWRQGGLAGGFKNAFARQGFDYGPSLSPTTVGRHPSEYERTYDGRRIVLGPHLRLGRGSPEACCRIYLYLDEERRCCVVGHVGNHLSDSTTG